MMGDMAGIPPLAAPAAPTRWIVSPVGHLFMGAAVTMSANLVVGVVAWLCTPTIDGAVVYLTPVTIAFVVSLAVGVVLLRTSGLRWSGAGVLVGTPLAIVMTRPVLMLLFGW